MKPVQLAVVAACLCAVNAGWLPEKVVKKFAMKKVHTITMCDRNVFFGDFDEYE